MNKTKEQNKIEQPPKSEVSVKLPRNFSIEKEIGRLKLGQENDSSCFYEIHSARRSITKDLFRIDSRTGSIYLVRSAEDLSIRREHSLLILFICSNFSQISQIRFNVEFLDENPESSTRFSRDFYYILLDRNSSSSNRSYSLNLTLIHREKTSSGEKFVELQPSDETRIVEGISFVFCCFARFEISKIDFQ